MTKTIFFSVGEPSGDQHAARLIDAMHRETPNIRFRGFGGPAMEQAGCEIELDLTQHAVVGLVEVLPKLRQFFGFANQAETLFRDGGIDAVVLVDFPGFNWHIAKRAKRYGVPVYYYCPPQLWAWGGWRRKKMRRLVDHVLAVLPIEERYFSSHGIPTTFVGHPFFDAVAEKRLDTNTLERLKGLADRGERLIAVLPGSRDHEVFANWPLMLESVLQLRQLHPSARFLVAAYNERHAHACEAAIKAIDPTLPIEVYVGRTSEIIQSAHCAMMVSGSVSLELMARGIPAVVIYRVGRLLHTFGRIMVGVHSITLPNLMEGRPVYPEFVSVGSAVPAVDFLVRSIDALVSDAYYYQQITRRLRELRGRYAQPGASQRAADWLVDALFSGNRSEVVPTLPGHQHAVVDPHVGDAETATLPVGSDGELRTWQHGDRGPDEHVEPDDRRRAA